MIFHSTSRNAWMNAFSMRYSMFCCLFFCSIGRLRLLFGEKGLLEVGEESLASLKRSKRESISIRDDKFIEKNYLGYYIAWIILCKVGVNMSEGYRQPTDKKCNYIKEVDICLYNLILNLHVLSKILQIYS